MMEIEQARNRELDDIKS